jgi:hypothetical protein
MCGRVAENYFSKLDRFDPVGKKVFFGSQPDRKNKKKQFDPVEKILEKGPYIKTFNENGT